MSIERTLNLKALASALGKDASWLSKKALPHVLVGSVKLYNSDECRAWIASNVRELAKKPKPVSSLLESIPESGSSQAPAIPQKSALALDADNPIITDLKSGDPLRVTRAAAALAGLRVAHAAQQGHAGANDLDDLKKALGELRQAEDSYIELGIRKGEIIERSTACEIIGSCCSRLVECLNVLENSIAVEFDMWLSDESMRGSSETRQRKIRDYVAGLGYQIRRQEADGVDALIDARKAESDMEKSHDA